MTNRLQMSKVMLILCSSFGTSRLQTIWQQKWQKHPCKNESSITSCKIKNSLHFSCRGSS